MPFGNLISGQPFQLIPPIQRLDKRLRLAPVGLDDHVQLQIHACAEQRLDLPPRARADLLQLRAALADQNRFLPVALAVDGGGDAGKRQARRRRSILLAR